MLKEALSKLEVVFSSTELTKGKAYRDRGYVLHLRLSDGLLKARVKGDSNQIYSVYLDLRTWPIIAAECTCHKGKHCKHVAACFFSLKNKDTPELTSSFSSEAKSKKNKLIKLTEAQWFSQLDPASNNFFNYRLGILIDNKEIDIMPYVVALVEQYDKKDLELFTEQHLISVQLPDHITLEIPWERIKLLFYFLFYYQGSVSTKLDVNRYHLEWLQKAEQTLLERVNTHQGGIKSTLLRQLSTFSDLPKVKLPQGLNATLRDYQYEGLQWLQSLRGALLGGILADDMGLGKTLQTLSHLLLEKEQGRLHRASLIIVPTSLVRNWLNEAKRFTPSLKVLIYHGSRRHSEKFADYDVIISTYGLAKRDAAHFKNYFFYYLILDEAQFIKNSSTRTTLIIHQLVAEHRLCLTGTPVENHLGELWSLFHFIMPGSLGTVRQFRRFFKTPIEKNNDSLKKALLTSCVAPFLLRRSKNQVANELPTKTEIIYPIELSDKQRDLYESIRLTMEKKVREAIAKSGVGRSQILFLDALLKLRQVCCDPQLLRLPAAEKAFGNSAKLDALLAMLKNLLDEGRRILVFSQFTSMLKLIEAQLIEQNVPYLKLTGQTQNRQRLVDSFQNGEAPVFLISLKAGGTGLNLTRADTVIHYDPWWNPAIEDQATDRSHRIGQTNPVFVYKLVTVGTVEEAIINLQKKKRKLVEGVLTNASGMALTEELITQFFQSGN